MTLQDSLNRVNLLDLRVRGLSSRFESSARRHRALTNKVEQKQQQVAELESQLKIKRAHAAMLEQEVDDIEAKIIAHREQMNSVTDHKQYGALTTEVQTLKTRKDELEKEALDALSGVEEDDARLGELKNELANQQKLADAAAAEVEKAKGEVSDKLEEAKKEYEEAKAELPPKALATYLKLSDLNDGEALGTVKIQNLKYHEYVNTASQMTVPVDMVNRLITNPDELIVDAYSNTIVVLDESVTEKLAEAKK